MLAEGAWISQQTHLGRSSDIHGFLDPNLVIPVALTPASPIILGLMTQGPISRHLGEAVSWGHQKSPSVLRTQGTLYRGSNAIQQPSLSVGKDNSTRVTPASPNSQSQVQDETSELEGRVGRRRWR